MISKESIAVIFGTIALTASKNFSKQKNEPTPISLISKCDLIDILKTLKPNEYIHGTRGFKDHSDPILYRNPEHPPVFTEWQESISPDMGIYLTKNLDYRGFATNSMKYICIVEAEDSQLRIDEDWLGDSCMQVLVGKQFNQEADEMLRTLSLRALGRFGDTKLQDMYTSLNQYVKELEIRMKHEETAFVEIEFAAAFGKRINKVITPEETGQLIEWSRMGMFSSEIQSFWIPDPDNKGIKPKKIYQTWYEVGYRIYRL